VPHSNRGLLALPGFVLLAVNGAQWAVTGLMNSSLNKKIVGTHGEKNMMVKAIIGSVVMIHLGLFLAYQRDYYSGFAADSATDFKDGYLEALATVIPYEKGLDGHQKVDQVIFSSAYGQPYIYTLFARRTNPIWYQHGVLNTYLFLDEIKPEHLALPNRVVVASDRDPLPIDQADKLIYGSDGQIKFKIYITDPI